MPSWLATAAAWAWRLLLVLVVATALLLLARRLALVTLPVFIAILLATLCVPPARWLEARGAPRGLAAGIVVVGGLAVVGGIIAALVPAFSEQVEALVPTVRDGANRFIRAVEASPLDYDRDKIADFFQQLTQRAGGAEEQGEIAGQVAAGAILLVELVTGLVLSLVVLFFLVKDGGQIVAWGLARTPAPYRDVVRATGRRAWLALSAFIRGTVFIATVDAVLIGIGLALLRVPLVLPLALLVFFGAFVPVIGAFVSGLVAVLVALAAGGPLTALFVLLVVVGVQQVEGQVLQPVLLRRAVALHPVVVLLAITAGAVLAGLPGAFLAVPLSATASSVANELRLRSERYAGDITAGGGEPLGPEPVGHTSPQPTVLERRREQR
ncbi:MAG: AI-2E family transporter [Nitriliruptor sp.]|uniref:AI-2E family transporter n=1 Tax=Nitriliruptor sp. TaxID=2448056 RepID=UPI00349FDC33